MRRAELSALEAWFRSLGTPRIARLQRPGADVAPGGEPSVVEHDGEVPERGVVDDSGVE